MCQWQCERSNHLQITQSQCAYNTTADEKLDAKEKNVVTVSESNHPFGKKPTIMTQYDASTFPKLQNSGNFTTPINMNSSKKAVAIVKEWIWLTPFNVQISIDIH